MKLALVKKQGITGPYEYHREDASEGKYLSDKFVESNQMLLVQLIKNGDLDAREALIIRNIHLVNSIASEFKNNGLTNLELILKGSSALVKAAENYNEKIDINYNAYCTLCIRQSIKQAITENMKHTRIPLNRIGLIPNNTNRKSSMAIV